MTLPIIDLALHYVVAAMPFGVCLTTLALCDPGPRQVEPAWTAICPPDWMPVSEAVDLQAGALAANRLAEAVATAAQPSYHQHALLSG